MAVVTKYVVPTRAGNLFNPRGAGHRRDLPDVSRRTELVGSPAGTLLKTFAYSKLHIESDVASLMYMRSPEIAG